MDLVLTRSRNRLVLVLVAVAFVLAFGSWQPASASGTQTADSDTTTTSVIAEIPHSIQRPNTGTPPTDPGDRGGWLQGAIFFIICAGVVVIGVLVVRESRKARARRGF